MVQNKVGQFYSLLARLSQMLAHTKSHKNAILSLLTLIIIYPQGLRAVKK